MTGALPATRRRHITMAFSICVALATACFLAVGVHTNSLPDKHKEQPTPTAETPTVNLTDDEEDEDTNSTVDGFTITQYMYLDMPKIGYHIFLTKMLEALRILSYFMKMDPVLMRITRTYLFTNETEDESDPTNNQMSLDGAEMPADQPIETNTESPLKASESEVEHKENTHKEHEGKPNEKQHKTEAAEKSDEKQHKTEETAEKGDKPVTAVKEDEKPQKTEDEHKSEETSQGFFSSAASAVSSFFNSLTNWG